MKQRILVILIAAFMVLGSVIGQPPSVSAGSPQQKGTEHRFRVGKLNSKWTVHDHKNPQNRIIKAKRGDKVIWSAVGSGIFLNFPDETLFGTDQASAIDGKEIALTVSPNAKAGTYKYSVFCAKDSVFARGDSPPVIIIE